MSNVEYIQNYYIKIYGVRSMRIISSIKEIQDIEYDILVKFDEFCKNNSIVYYLAYGTLLGAVRHQGFIPWDDDVDIIMDPQNYDRFHKMTRGKEIAPHIRVQSPYDISKNIFSYSMRVYDDRTSLPSDSMHAKMTPGVCIDIMALGGVPDKKVPFKLFQYWVLFLLKNMNRGDFEKGPSIIKNIIKYFLFIPLRVAGKQRMYLFFCNLYKFFNYTKSDYVDIAICYPFWKAKSGIPKKWFEGDAIHLKFNGGVYPVPSEYKLLLKHWYGDYMKLPLPEQRADRTHYGSYVLVKE